MSITPDLIESLIVNLRRATASFPYTVQALSKSQQYRGHDPLDRLYQELSSEVSLYGEQVHSEALFIVTTIIEIAEWCQATARLHSNAVSKDLLSDCRTTLHLAGQLKFKYSTVLDRLENLGAKIDEEKKKPEATPDPENKKKMDWRPLTTNLLIRVRFVGVTPRLSIRRRSSNDRPPPTETSTRRDLGYLEKREITVQSLLGAMRAFRELVESMQIVCDVVQRLMECGTLREYEDETSLYQLYYRVVEKSEFIMEEGKSLLTVWMTPESELFKKQQYIINENRVDYLHALENTRESTRIIRIQ